MEPLVFGAHENIGWIEVICGSMFSGKTEELIRRLRRAQIAGQTVESFKPALDTRYRPEAVVSHNQTTLASTSVQTAAQIARLADGLKVVGIDEAQFFDGALVDVCQELAGRGTRVVVAGLDQDFRGAPFEPVPQLMAVAEHVTKLHAICVKCGAPANHSQRLVAGTKRILRGADEAYEPRCRRCFEPSPAGSLRLRPAEAKSSNTDQAAVNKQPASRGKRAAKDPTAPELDGPNSSLHAPSDH